MKNLTTYLIIFFVFYYANTSFSQIQNYDCGFNETVEAGDLKSLSCDNSSNSWLNKYRLPDNWIANNNTPIKTILVNYIVCQKNDGTNGWQDIPEFREQVDMMFDSINEIYSHVKPKGYSLTCEQSINYITDTRIRFELNKIIFIKNDAFNEATFSNGGAYDVLDWLYNNYPDTENQLNHIFTMGDSPNWGRYVSNTLGNSYVITYGSMFSEWWFVFEGHINHIAHEYGHAVGLHHTYNSEPINISHYDFLDDVFGLCGESSCCIAPSGQVCYLKRVCFWDFQPTPYPLMYGGTENQRYISPKQSGRMDRSLSLYDNIFVVNNKNMHRYVKEITPFETSLKITQNETWDFKIKSYQNIIIKTGNTLTIKCEVMMPNDGKIIVEQGARLIIDGGKVTNYHYLGKNKKTSGKVSKFGVQQTKTNIPLTIQLTKGCWC